MGATFCFALCRALKLVPGGILERSAKIKAAERLKKAEKASLEDMKKLRKLFKCNNKIRSSSGRGKKETRMWPVDLTAKDSRLRYKKNIKITETHQTMKF